MFYGVNVDPERSAIKWAPVHEAGGVFTREIQKKMDGYVVEMARGKLMTGVDHKSGESRNSGECKCALPPDCFCSIAFAQLLLTLDSSSLNNGKS